MSNCSGSDDENSCDLCGDSPRTDAVKYMNDTGDATISELVCKDCIVTCLYCAAKLPAYDDFNCTECKSIVCAQCSFAKLGKKGKSGGKRQCLACTSAMVKERMRQVGAKVSE